MKFQLPRLRFPFLLVAPSLALLICLFVAPMILLGRVSLYEGGGSSGFGIGGGGFYKPDTWTLGAYTGLLSDQYFREVLTFTVLLGIGITFITLVLAYPLALIIQGLPSRLKVLSLTAVVLPKLANPLVVIYGMELILGNTGPVNQVFLALGIISQPLTLFHNLTGVVISETYLILPYSVLILVTAFDRIDMNLVPAARGLGASPWKTFWRVTFPLSLPGLYLATMLSLIFALGAFEGPYLMGSPQEITLAVDIQKQTFENLNWPRGAAEAIMMLVTLCVCIALYSFSTQFMQRLRRVS